jgi:hypothetical protein
VPFRLVSPSGGLLRIRSVPCSMRVARHGGRFTGLHLATCPAPAASGIQRSVGRLDTDIPRSRCRYQPNPGRLTKSPVCWTSGCVPRRVLSASSQPQTPARLACPSHLSYEASCGAAIVLSS